MEDANGRLIDEPEIRSPPAANGIDRVAIRFEQISVLGLGRFRREKDSQERFVPSRRLDGIVRILRGAHTAPLSGHRMPCHSVWTAARALLSASTPDG